MMLFSILDEVKLKSGFETYITEVHRTETERLEEEEVVLEITYQYRVKGNGFMWKAKDLTYIGMREDKSKEVDKVIIDSMLLSRNFDFIEQMLNKGGNDNE
mgnify:CR=1 FL=1